MQARRVSGRKVRYAVVGGGWISQAAFMPGVAQTGNSEMTAIVTGDPEKAQALAKTYGLTAFTYDRYKEALASDLFDAVWVRLELRRREVDALAEHEVEEARELVAVRLVRRLEVGHRPFGEEERPHRADAVQRDRQTVLLRRALHPLFELAAALHPWCTLTAHEASPPRPGRLGNESWSARLGTAAACVPSR